MKKAARRVAARKTAAAVMRKAAVRKKAAAVKKAVVKKVVHLIAMRKMNNKLQRRMNRYSHASILNKLQKTELHYYQLQNSQRLRYCQLQRGFHQSSFDRHSLKLHPFHQILHQIPLRPEISQRLQIHHRHLHRHHHYLEHLLNLLLLPSLPINLNHSQEITTYYHNSITFLSLEKVGDCILL